MPIAVACPSCGRGFNVPDTAAQRKFECLKCGAVFVVPAAGFDKDPAPPTSSQQTKSQQQAMPDSNASEGANRRQKSPRERSQRKLRRIDSDLADKARYRRRIVWILGIISAIFVGGIAWLVIALIKKEPGTLELRFGGVDASHIPTPIPGARPGVPDPRVKDMELFVDGKPQELSSGITNPLELRLPPGNHTVLVKKRGVEICSNTVDVKKPADGRTYVELTPIITGTVRLIWSEPPALQSNVEYLVRVKPNFVMAWPAGKKRLKPSFDVTADFGNRLVEIYRSEKRAQLGATSQFGSTAAGSGSPIWSMDVEFEAGKTIEIDIQKKEVLSGQAPSGKKQ
jgi:hypothetical protein